MNWLRRLQIALCLRLGWWAALTVAATHDLQRLGSISIDGECFKIEEIDYKGQVIISPE